MNHITSNIGRGIINGIGRVGDALCFFGRAMRLAVTPPLLILETVKQLQIIGVQSLLLVSVVSFSIGLVSAMESLHILQKFGATQLIAFGVGLSMVRELGPLLTGLVLAGRAGSGISAEIGAMNVTHQIDALTVSAVDPVKFLAATRIIASMIALPLLTIVADACGILGGCIMSFIQAHLSPLLYFTLTFKAVGATDIVAGLIKAFFFGLCIGLIGTYQGFKTTGGTEGVGRSTTSTVAIGCLSIMVADVFLTKLLLIVF
ncbi:MAG TPA: ABC transporter permease [Candidatus Omnitrophica bacterium]|nr:ABC transporter permease [Candidatus Omnitrophota bacterium]